MWTASYASLARHRKTRRLARHLDTTRRDTVGLLHLLWYYAIEQAEDGDLCDHDASDIAAAVDWNEGEAEELVAALIASGFMSEDRTLHDWPDYFRAHKARDRKRLQRERRNGEKPRHGTVTGQSRDSHNMSRPTGQDRTGQEKQNNPADEPPPGDAAAPKKNNGRSKSALAAAVPIPADLDTPEFRKVWSERLEERKQAGKIPTVIAIQRQFSTLSKMGPAKACRAIEQSIEAGWQKIAEPRDGNSQGGFQRPAGLSAPVLGD